MSATRPSFRKVDVDQYTDEKYPEEEEDGDQRISVDDGVMGPADGEVQAMLSQYLLSKSYHSCSTLFL